MSARTHTKSAPLTTSSKLPSDSRSASCKVSFPGRALPRFVRCSILGVLPVERTVPRTAYPFSRSCFTICSKERLSLVLRSVLPSMRASLEKKGLRRDISASSCHHHLYARAACHRSFKGMRSGSIERPGIVRCSKGTI